MVAARSGRWEVAAVLDFDAEWRGKRYAQKRVRVIFALADDVATVVSVITQFGRWPQP
jgi:hypothetical protein